MAIIFLVGNEDEKKDRMESGGRNDWTVILARVSAMVKGTRVMVCTIVMMSSWYDPDGVMIIPFPF